MELMEKMQVYKTLMKVKQVETTIIILKSLKIEDKVMIN